MSILLASLFAAITAVTVSSKVDVPINDVYVPIVVFGSGAWGLEQGNADAVNAQDVTEQQIDAVKARIVAGGIAADRIQTWMQPARMFARRNDPRTSLQIGIVVVDFGSPATARDAITLLSKLGQPALHFGWNQFAGVDCQAMAQRVRAQIDADARATAERFAAANGAQVTIRSVTPTATDPRTPPFDPIALCPASAHPVVQNAGLRPPTIVSDVLTRYISSSVELVYDASPPKVAAIASTAPIFPFGTFGFPTPIIGHQNQAYTLRGGRYIAVPGASEVAVPVDSALIVYKFRARDNYEAAVRAVRGTGLATEDYRINDDAMQLGVRLRPGTMQLWSKFSSLGDGTPAGLYRFIGDCGSLREHVQALALERSRRLAEAAAAVLQVTAGPLVVQTDWAGPSSDAICGNDGLGDMAALIGSATHEPGWPLFDPTYANFWDSIYAAWTLGTHAPSVVSHKIVERLVPVIQSTGPSSKITGTATITPDAYFYTNRDLSNFTVGVVASKADVPKGVAPGNVVTDCDAAQQQSLANAIKVAALSGPVGSLYADPANFLSIACLDKRTIGHTYSSLPTVYNAASPTGDAQVTTTITVYP